jgi:hypothetical protein
MIVAAYLDGAVTGVFYEEAKRFSSGVGFDGASGGI